MNNIGYHIVAMQLYPLF